MATTSSENRLRQIAVLVASVDSASARHLLLNLPTEIAKKVRSLAAEMGPIPPEERKQLMLELKRVQDRGLSRDSGPVHLQVASTASTGPASGDSKASSTVWSDWPQENRAELDQLDNLATPKAQTKSADSLAPAWTRLSVDALLRFVRHERPTVIAVIVSQLSAVQAAAILQRLPRSVSRDVLQCLGSLKEIDSEARQTIDEHLSQRLSEYRIKIETEVENARRINELLTAAPPELKQQWASWLRPEVYLSEATSDPHNRSSTTLAVSTQATEDQTTEMPSTIPFPATGNSASDSARPKVAGAKKPTAAARTLRSIDLEVVLTLSPDQLASLLGSLDSQTILLALAGASPQFMNRFSAMLETSDARALNDRIEKIGPLQLRDIDEAQKRIIDAYWAVMGPMGLRLSA